MADEGDLYAALGLSRTASDDEIKKAYRKLARTHHPDLNPGDAAAEERFKAIAAAYEVLSDPERRALYDEFGTDSTKLGFDPEQARAYQQWQQSARHTRRTEPADMDDLLSQLFGRDAGVAFRGADIHAELATDFLSAVRGGQRELTFSDGRTIRVRLPPGVRDSETLTLRGQGGSGAGGGPAGDLLVTIRVAPDRLFRRDGEDLHLEVPVTVGEAMRGASVSIPTLEGDVRLRVPPGSQSGQRLRLRGKGVTRGKNKGDLLAQLKIVVPTGELEEEVLKAAEVVDGAYNTDVRESLRRQR